MALIVEDGTGLSTAESYISVADASTYFTNRGVTAWAALDEGEAETNREAYLRLATDYMIQMFRNRWEGVRYTEDQALDWPRMGVVRDSWQVDTDEIPEEVKRACAELALKASSGSLAPDLKQQKLSVTVGPIKTEWDKTSPQYKRYRAIEAMISPYLKPGGGVCVALGRV